MPNFSYTAIDTRGATTRGALVAMSETEALEALARKGLTPTDLRRGTGAAVPWWQREIGGAKPKPARLLPVFVSLATLLEAQVPLTDALRFVEAQAEDPALRIAISGTREDLENGQTLQQALAERDDVFPARIASLLVMGDRSDTLAETCQRIVHMLRSEAEVAAEVRSALVYPVILLGMSLLVLSLLVFYLVPTLLPVFETADATPPAVLQGMDAVRRALTDDGLSVLALVLAAGLALVLLRRPMRAVLHRALIAAPVTGPYLRKRHSLSFCQNLGLMVEAGMSSVDGIEAAEAAMPAGPWRSALRTARTEIEAGASLSTAIGRISFLDPMAASLIQAGDETDRLGPMLRAASEAMQGETRTTLKRALALLTPAMTLALGVLVGVLIVSTITAILDLNDIAF
ncbi:MAG: type II secretion system F family protein [Pseudomonadota bacterium]